MAELWIYQRRPSSLVRYRHGGAAAFEPVVRSPLARAVAVASAPVPHEEQKILKFPGPAPVSRSSRPQASRAGRGKPRKPKKRD